MAANMRCVCLADSTGFGLLPPGSRSGIVEAETTLGRKFTAAISYGACLTAPSGDGAPSLMQLLLQLQQEAQVPLSAPVFCGCVPARDSVPPKPGAPKEEGFKGLVEGRAQYHVKDITGDGVDLELCLVRQVEAMSALGLEVCDLGAINRNERGEDIYNQCFYLALARSYLGCDSDVLKETALMFKRNIEAAVLAAHPEWGGSRVGEDVQAFSDFLFYVLGSH
ncbi:unnamed protein product, partial [Symbiodinium sp. CCMP2592]